jgi:hypothetical protein
VSELGIRADGNDFGACFFEGFMLLCQSSEFSCSDKSKIGGVEEKDCPFSGGLLRGQRDFAEIAFRGIEGFELEIRYCLTYSYGATLFRHGRYLLKKC